MTYPIDGQPSFTRKQYIQIDGSAYKTAKGQNISNGFSAKLGTIINTNNGPNLEGNIGFGTEVQLYGKISYEFDIDKKTGVEIFADGKFLRQLSHHKIDKGLLQNPTNPDNQEKEQDGYRKLGTGILVNFKGKKSSIKFGLETGYRKNFIELEQNNGTTIDNQTIAPLSGKLSPTNKNSNLYITPKLCAEWTFGKKNNFSMLANADFFGGEAGFRYKF